MGFSEERLLTEAHKKILTLLPDEIRENYALGGGTALSLFYFKHRRSDDLDFFCLKEGSRELSTPEIENIISKSGLQVKFIEKLHDRRIFKIEGIKVEFIPTYFRRLHQPERKGNLYVESLEDILANKLIALVDRNELRDWIDLYFASKNGYPPMKVYELANRKWKANYEYAIDFDNAIKTASSADMSFMVAKLEKEDIIRFIEEFRNLLINHRIKTVSRKRGR